MFSLNKVAPCKVQPENIKVTHAYVTLYQRHYRTKVNATMCRIKHQSLRCFCDSFDSSGIDARQNISLLISIYLPINVNRPPTEAILT